jgi:hypothetical protein
MFLFSSLLSTKIRWQFLSEFHILKKSRGSSGSIVSDYRLDDRGLIPDGQRIFLLAPASRPALEPTQPPIQWVLGVLSLGVKHGRGVTLTTHPHLVPRSRMSRSYNPPPTPPWHVVGQLTLPHIESLAIFVFKCHNILSLIMKFIRFNFKFQRVCERIILILQSYHVFVKEALNIYVSCVCGEVLVWYLSNLFFKEKQWGGRLKLITVGSTVLS